MTNRTNPRPCRTAPRTAPAPDRLCCPGCGSTHLVEVVAAFETASCEVHVGNDGEPRVEHLATAPTVAVVCLACADCDATFSDLGDLVAEGTTPGGPDAVLHVVTGRLLTPQMLRLARGYGRTGTFDIEEIFGDLEPIR